MSEHWSVISCGYSVSDLGRVKNKRGLIIKSFLSKDGYKRVSLFIYGKYRRFFVHRLVALLFVPGFRYGMYVNHKNEIKADNRADNLEWCTASYNTNYGSRTRRMLETRSKRAQKYAETPVIQSDMDGNIIAVYRSQSEAARQTGLQQTAIGKCCRGEITNTHHYKFTFKQN